MKKRLLRPFPGLLLALLLPVMGAAQTAPAPCDSVLMVADEMPVYKKGLEDFIRDVRKELKLPHGCHPDKITLRWVVDKTGKLADLQVTSDAMDEKCREAFLSNLQTLPAWKPARHKGRPACVRMEMPMYVHYKENSWGDD